MNRLLLLVFASLLIAACGVANAPSAGPTEPVRKARVNSDTSSSGSAATSVAPAAGATTGPAVVPTAPSNEQKQEANVPKKQYSSPPKNQIDPNKSYTATIETNKGTIVAELYAKGTPKTVNNFVFLARDGYYNGVPFHRVMNGFMVQTGDPTGTGMGGPGYTFNDEPVTRKYEEGTLAMANSGPNTNGSQFFIVQGQGGQMLQPNYTIFGKVIKGQDVVNKLAATPVGASDTGEMSVPKEPLNIQTVKIDEK